MGLKNTAMKFFWSDEMEEQQEEYTRYRIFDYLNGVSYIINADVKKINDDLLLYAPEQVQVNKEEARTSSNVRSWLSK